VTNDENDADADALGDEDDREVVETDAEALEEADVIDVAETEASALGDEVVDVEAEDDGETVGSEDFVDENVGNEASAVADCNGDPLDDSDCDDVLVELGVRDDDDDPETVEVTVGIEE
jgi:hypothetical protein